MECRDGKSELKKHLKSFSSYIRDRVEVWVFRDCNRTGLFFFYPWEMCPLLANVYREKRSNKEEEE